MADLEQETPPHWYTEGDWCWIGILHDLARERFNLLARHLVEQWGPCCERGPCRDFDES